MFTSSPKRLVKFNQARPEKESLPSKKSSFGAGSVARAPPRISQKKRSGSRYITSCFPRMTCARFLHLTMTCHPPRVIPQARRLSKPNPARFREPRAATTRWNYGQGRQSMSTKISLVNSCPHMCIRSFGGESTVHSQTQGSAWFWTPAEPTWRPGLSSSFASCSRAFCMSSSKNSRGREPVIMEILLPLPLPFLRSCTLLLRTIRYRSCPPSRSNPLTASVMPNKRLKTLILLPLALYRIVCPFMDTLQTRRPALLASLPQTRDMDIQRPLMCLASNRNATSSTRSSLVLTHSGAVTTQL